MLTPTLTILLSFIAAIGLAALLEWFSLHERRLLELPVVDTRLRWLRGAFIVLAIALLFGFFHWASLERGCLETAEVQPSGLGRYWRLGYHLILVSLLVLATAIDFDCYMIPDLITFPGMLVGVAGAAIIGEVQICHLWVDWTVAIPQLRALYPSLVRCLSFLARSCLESGGTRDRSSLDRYRPPHQFPRPWARGDGDW